MPAPAPQIEVWYGARQRFGRLGRSNRWINVLGRVTPHDEVYDLRWYLNDDPEAKPLPWGPTAYRLLGRGDFNLEIDPTRLRVGLNRIRVEALDRAGRVGEADVEVELHDPTDVPLPMRVDFADLERLDEAAHVVDGHWRLTDTGVQPVEIGYDRVLALGHLGWRDYEVTASFTVHGYSEDPKAYHLPCCGTLVGVILRWQGHVDWHDLTPYRGYKPFGILALHLHRFKGVSRWAIYGNDDALNPPDEPDRELELDRRHWVKVRCVTRPGTTTRYDMKFWADGGREPKRWRFGYDGRTDELTRGAVALVAHQTRATFHDVEVRPVDPADALFPDVPAANGATQRAE